MTNYQGFYKQIPLSGVTVFSPTGQILCKRKKVRRELEECITIFGFW
jgi:hypothetical protein